MPLDALLIEHVEQPANVHGYYAMIFDETTLALRNHTPPYQLEAFVLANADSFFFNMPALPAQPWRFFVKLLAANMNLPNISHGCYYTIIVFARAAAGVQNPAVDAIRLVKRMLWLSGRELDTRLDPLQEQTIGLLAAQAVMGIDMDDPEVNDLPPESFLKQVQGVGASVLANLAAPIAAIGTWIEGQPTELAAVTYVPKVSAGYDDEQRRLGIVVWLERDGQLYSLVTEVRAKLLDSSTNEIAAVNSSTVAEDGQFNMSIETLDLSPDEVYFVIVEVDTVDEHTYKGATSLVTWD